MLQTNFKFLSLKNFNITLGLMLADSCCTISHANSSNARKQAKPVFLWQIWKSDCFPDDGSQSLQWCIEVDESVMSVWAEVLCACSPFKVDSNGEQPLIHWGFCTSFARQRLESWCHSTLSTLTTRVESSVSFNRWRHVTVTHWLCNLLDLGTELSTASFPALLFNSALLSVMLQHISWLNLLLVLLSDQVPLFVSCRWEKVTFSSTFGPRRSRLERWWLQGRAPCPSLRLTGCCSWVTERARHWRWCCGRPSLGTTPGTLISSLFTLAHTILDNYTNMGILKYLFSFFFFTFGTLTKTTMAFYS